MPETLNTHRERERKFTVSPDFTLPELQVPEHGVVIAEPAEQRALRSTYWDTADLRLARDGITLRYRTGEGTPGWQLKLPLEGTDREEIAATGSPTKVPAALRELITAWVRQAPLVAVTTLRTERTAYLLRDAEGRPVAEIVDDHVSVVDGRRVVSQFREIEAELATPADDAAVPAPRDAEARAGSDENLGSTTAPLDPEQALAVLAARFTAAGAVEGEFLPKAARALGPAAAAEPEIAEPGKVSRRRAAQAVLVRSLRVNTRRLRRADVGVRRRHPDAVHQMRVACRRMRSDLKIFAPLVDPAWSEPLRTELAWLAGALGAARDLEVLRERTGEQVEAPTAVAWDLAAVRRIDEALVLREQQALAEASAALTSPRYVALLETLVAAAREPATNETAAEAAVDVFPPLLNHAWERLARRAARLSPEQPDDPWHETRIVAKRARYAAEATAGVLGKPALRVGAAATAVQEVLGRHQDAAVAAETLMSLLPEHPDDAGLHLAVGRLVERNRAEVTAIRADFAATWKAAGRAVRR